MTFHDGGKIDDQHHPAVAQDGSSADQVGRYRLIVERLDHEFFFAFEPVHDHPQLAFAHRNHEHKDFSRPCLVTISRGAPQADQRQDAVAQLQDFVVLYLMHVGFAGARNFRHRIQGNGIQPLLDPEQQGLDDREREWQLQAEGGALARPGLDFDRAFKAVHHGLHHIQADAAAGDLGDLNRRAESGPKHQCENFSFLLTGLLLPQ